MTNLRKVADPTDRPCPLSLTSPTWRPRPRPYPQWSLTPTGALLTLRSPTQTVAVCPGHRLPAQPQRVLPSLHYTKGLQGRRNFRRLRESTEIREASFPLVPPPIPDQPWNTHRLCLSQVLGPQTPPPQVYYQSLVPIPNPAPKPSRPPIQGSPQTKLRLRVVTTMETGAPSRSPTSAVTRTE